MRRVFKQGWRGFNLPREGVQVEAADELGALGLAGLGAFLVELGNEMRIYFARCEAAGIMCIPGIRPGYRP